MTQSRGATAITPEVIAAIAGRIVALFSPLQVILFGSQARGDAHRWSDVDLLVVMPRVEDRYQCRTEIDRALRDFDVSLDVTVTTPEEIAHRGDLVGTVLRPALREGKVLYEREGYSLQQGSIGVSEEEILREVGNWLTLARDDLALAEVVLRQPELQPRNAGFHAQQAAEKALKAIYVFLQVQYPLTHDLDKLRDGLPDGSRVQEEHPNLVELSKWAVEPRYPGLFANTSRQAVGVFVQQARALLDSVLRDLEAHGNLEEGNGQ